MATRRSGERVAELLARLEELERRVARLERKDRRQPKLAGVGDGRAAARPPPPGVPRCPGCGLALRRRRGRCAECGFPLEV